MMLNTKWKSINFITIMKNIFKVMINYVQFYKLLEI